MSCFNVNIKYKLCLLNELCITLILYDKDVLNTPTNFENIKKVIHIYIYIYIYINVIKCI